MSINVTQVPSTYTAKWVLAKDGVFSITQSWIWV